MFHITWSLPESASAALRSLSNARCGNAAVTSTASLCALDCKLITATVSVCLSASSAVCSASSTCCGSQLSAQHSTLSPPADPSRPKSQSPSASAALHSEFGACCDGNPPTWRPGVGLICWAWRPLQRTWRVSLGRGLCDAKLLTDEQELYESACKAGTVADCSREPDRGKALHDQGSSYVQHGQHGRSCVAG